MIRLHRDGVAAIGPGELSRLLDLIAALPRELDEDRYPSVHVSGRGFRVEATNADELHDDLGQVSYDDLDDIEIFASTSETGARLLNLRVRLSKTPSGWAARCAAEAARSAEADGAVTRLVALVRDFGGPEPVTPNHDRPAEPRRIERSHEPEVWNRWAIKRQDYAELVEEMTEVLRTAGADEIEESISVPGFDDRFASSGEFLLNVNEQVWLDRERASFYARCRGGRLDGLSLSLGLGRYSVELGLEGATRADRNAVLPDLVSLVGRHESRPDDFRWWKTIRRTPYVLFVLLNAAGATAGGVAGGLEGLLIALLGSLVLSYPALFLVFRLETATDRASPAIEFLPDSGRSRWTKLLSTLESVGKRLLVLVTVLAALSGILKAFGAI